MGRVGLTLTLTLTLTLPLPLPLNPNRTRAVERGELEQVVALAAVVELLRLQQEEGGACRGALGSSARLTAELLHQQGQG